MVVPGGRQVVVINVVIRSLYQKLKRPRSSLSKREQRPAFNSPPQALGAAQRTYQAPRISRPRPHHNLNRGSVCNAPATSGLAAMVAVSPSLSATPEDRCPDAVWVAFNFHNLATLVGSLRTNDVVASLAMHALHREISTVTGVSLTIRIRHRISRKHSDSKVALSNPATALVRP